MTLGRYIRTARWSQGITLRAMQAKAGIDLPRLTQIEIDRVTATQTELGIIAAVLSLDLAELNTLAATTEIGRPLEGPVIECRRKVAPPKQMNFWEIDR